MTDSRSLAPFQAPPPPELVDGNGRPLRQAREILTREIAGPTMAGVRSIFSGHPAQGLDPMRLAQILRSAETGDATAYLELAEEMEEKDLHYQSVLGTRKRAVSQLPVEVEAASDDPEDEADAQLVRDWLKRLTLQAELFDILDAIGKGYSATEIIWELTPDAWLPESLERQDPRFFEFDRVTGKQLLLKGGIDGTAGLPQPLPPSKFIVHAAPAKSGIPIRGGLARGIAWIYLFKNYTLKDWMTFLEVYGLPLRVGKYQNGTSEDDIRKLAQAVAQVGSDAGCVIPASMQMEFITSQGGAANPDMFKQLCVYADELISKATVGQTTSADAKATGLGSGVADSQSEVRDDIKDADAMQLSATLTGQVGKPIVQFNRGPRKRYPLIKVGRPDVIDMKASLEAIAAGVGFNVPIGIGHFRKVTGIPEPKPGEELLTTPKPPQTPQDGQEAPGGPSVPEKAPRGLLAPFNRGFDGNRTEAAHVAASLRDSIATKFVAAALELVAAKHHSMDQPRVPAGTVHGGEFGSKGGAGIGVGVGGGGIGAGGAAAAGGGNAVPAQGKLTDADKKAVFDYSVMHYHKINEQARGEADHGPETGKRIAALDKAVGKGALKEDTTLYRGVSDTGVRALMKSGLSEGSVITDPGFASTSRNLDVVKGNFATARGSIVMHISAKRGTRALDIAKHSAVEMEEEVLFPRGSRMRVVKWDQKKRILHVEAVDAE